MKTLLKNDLIQIHGGVHTSETINESQILLTGACIGAIIGRVVFDTNREGILVSALAGSVLASVYLNSQNKTESTN